MTQILKNKKQHTWLNPYIELAQAKPNKILLARESEVNLEHITHIKKICNQYAQIYIEPGSGSGAHLIEQAKLKPETLFIGFELRFKRAYKTIIKAERLRLDNIMIVVGDAKKFLKFFDQASLAGCFINFPDPWDKRRWNKHRLIDQDLIDELARILKVDATFIYKTDHQDYFMNVKAILETSKMFKITYSSNDLYADAVQITNNIPTEFEKLFVSKKIPICRLEVVRCRASSV